MRALWCLPAPAVAFDWAARPFGIERRLPAGRNEVVLTFDDGPHARGTPAVLAALAAANVPATFFLVGEQSFCTTRTTTAPRARGNEPRRCYRGSSKRSPSAGSRSPGFRGSRAWARR
jgi:peptidoglycan/xylan/chitin deacetylase (PgdA/CDA1 family)